MARTSYLQVTLAFPFDVGRSLGFIHGGVLFQLLGIAHSNNDHVITPFLFLSPIPLSTGYATNVLEHRFMRMTAPETDFSYRVQVWADDGFYFQYDILHPRYGFEPSLKEKKKECEESIKYEQFMQVCHHASGVPRIFVHLTKSSCITESFF